MTDRMAAEDAIRTLLSYLEGSSDREGLRDTPARVIDSWEEIFAGYGEDVGALLGTTFDAEAHMDLVLLRSIEFHSTCEHHLQPFSGHADVAYLPNGRIVGISKLARLVDAHARRLQNQERITSGIVEDLMAHLEPEGAAVIVRARHGCMRCRGVMKQEAEMVTTAYRGVFAPNGPRHGEFLSLVDRR